MEIKNKLTVTRWDVGRGSWGKDWEGFSRNMYNRSMEKDKVGWGRIECGRSG